MLATLDYVSTLEIVRFLEGLAYLVAAAGFPLAILTYVREARKQREERELGTYSSLDDKYLHYLELCINNPELDMFLLPVDSDRKYDPLDMSRRYALFETLLSIFERAYLLYKRSAELQGKRWFRRLRGDSKSAVQRERQWNGWSAFLDDWIERKDFEALWDLLGKQFEKSFVEEVDGRIKKLREARAPSTGAQPQS